MLKFEFGKLYASFGHWRLFEPKLKYPLNSFGQSTA